MGAGAQLADILTDARLDKVRDRMIKLIGREVTAAFPECHVDIRMVIGWAVLLISAFETAAHADDLDQFQEMIEVLLRKIEARKALTRQ